MVPQIALLDKSRYDFIRTRLPSWLGTVEPRLLSLSQSPEVIYEVEACLIEPRVSTVNFPSWLGLRVGGEGSRTLFLGALLEETAFVQVIVRMFSTALSDWDLTL